MYRVLIILIILFLGCKKESSSNIQDSEIETSILDRELKDSIIEIGKDLGPTSILVNNAANDERHDIDSVTPEYWDDRININLKHA